MSAESEEGAEAHRRMRVLIVDDNIQMRGLLVILDEAHFPVEAVINDPRPIKGKFEPAHLFNSRMRDWRRRNP